ncbi:MAG: EGF domain-containing protein [Myxococcota bacterium]
MRSNLVRATLFASLLGAACGGDSSSGPSSPANETPAPRDPDSPTAAVSGPPLVDECALGQHDCHPSLGVCTDLAEGFECACAPGYEGDGRGCDDVDECRAATDDCGANAVCDNVPGSFMCTCNPGYRGDGLSCEDVDECALGLDDCGPGGACVNAPGGYACACDSGYVHSGTECVPRFDIVLVFTSEPSAEARAAFEAAESRWESLIVGDLPDLDLTRFPDAAATCGVPTGYEDIDDLVIEVQVTDIDGPGGILGSAGPRCARADTSLPINGVMIFDRADSQQLIATGTFAAVILHEMGHVLGLGSSWAPRGLLTNPSCPGGGSGSGADTRYIGAAAVAAWQELGGIGEVPVENRLGPGSCDGHWREDGPLSGELMSPLLSRNNILSIITLRSLEDLGYEVGPDSRADGFSLDAALRLGDAGAPVIKLEHDIYRGPRYEVRPDGALIPAR